MYKPTEFIPADLKIIGVSNQGPVGLALEIMFKAVGFGTVKIVTPEDVCKQAAKMNPDFIMFTPEYLESPVQEKLDIGCPCKEKKWCGKAQVVMLLRKQEIESVFSSKEMGFDHIVFADASLPNMYLAMERAYITYNDENFV